MYINAYTPRFWEAISVTAERHLFSVTNSPNKWDECTAVIVQNSLAYEGAH